MIRFALTTFVLSLSLALTGCLTPTGGKLPDQFLLRPNPEVSSASVTSATLGLRPIEAARPFQLAMAYIEANGGLNYYQSASWAEYPAVVATRALHDALDRTARFADVGMATEMARPNLMLIGYLNSCQENRSSGVGIAEVEIRLELRRAQQVDLLWSATLKQSEPLSGEGPAAFATAMQAALTRLVADAAAQIAALPIETPAP